MTERKGTCLVQVQRWHEFYINSSLELRARNGHSSRGCCARCWNATGTVACRVSFLRNTLALERLGQRRNLALRFVSPIGTFFNPIARLIAEVLHDVTRVLVLAAKGLAHLLPGLGGEQ